MNDRWPEWMYGALNSAWVQDLVLAVFGIVFATFFLNGLLAFLLKRARRSPYLLDDVLVEALQAPARFLVWTLILTFALRPLLVLGGVQAYLPQFQQLLVLAALGWFLFGAVRRYRDAAVRQARATGADIDFDMYMLLARVLQLVILVLVGIGILHTFNVSIAGILTFGGVGGLVVGFAAQDFLSNIFGGLMLHLDRPFRTGDWIRIRNTDIEGEVEMISWRQTRIRTFSKNMLFVPNGTFLSAVIENPSMMSHRMIKEMVGLRYDDFDKLPAIIRDVEAMLRAHPQLDSDMPLLVRFNAFNASSVDFFLQCYSPETARAKFTEIKQNVLYEVAAIVARHGAEIAYPTQTLHVHSAAG